MWIFQYFAFPQRFLLWIRWFFWKNRKSPTYFWNEPNICLLKLRNLKKIVSKEAYLVWFSNVTEKIWRDLRILETRLAFCGKTTDNRIQYTRLHLQGKVARKAVRVFLDNFNKKCSKFDPFGCAPSSWEGGFSEHVLPIWSKMWSDRICLDARQAPELADFGIKTWKMSKLPQCEPKEEKQKKQQHLPTKNLEALQHNRPFGQFLVWN